MNDKKELAKMESLSSDPLFRSPDVLKHIDRVVNKSYFQSLQGCSIQPCGDNAIDFAESNCFFPICKIVLNKKDNNIQKLASVYAGACGIHANLSMIIRGYENGEAELFLGVCNENNRINGAYPKAKGLLDSFVGNFPGCRDSRTKLLNQEETRVLQNKCFDLDYSSVACVSCIASRKEKGDTQPGDVTQGLEKVIETLSGQNYSIVILANPISSEEIERIKGELEYLYTSLSVYSKIQISSNWSTAKSISESYTNSISNGINQTNSATLNIGKSNTHSDSTSEYGGTSVGGNAYGLSSGFSSGNSHGESYGESNSFGRAVSETISKSQNQSVGETKTENDTLTLGETLQLSVENKTISEILKRIDEQLQRIQRGKGLGMFAAATYILSPSVFQARSAASTYKAVVSGSSTELECSAINVWSGKEFTEILAYLKQLRHPLFDIKQGDGNINQTVTPAVLTTSEELSILMGLPHDKVNGIPVRESVAFERNITRMNNYNNRTQFNLGKVYYLEHEEQSDVSLDLDSLTMHCLVSGTTGSGKSNTVYGLLNNALSVKSDLHFLVIEPVKGDYKTVFGHMDDVEVYGTNESITKLLRINPFRFRKEIHVLEHIDYLISIFNVCWPMEAAMPSVLKQAVERAYEISGWDLRKSKNEFSDKIFPTFSDVFKCINQIMDESEYSEENKGNYKGALCTRLEELTTGTNSLIFTSNDLSDEDLFDKNVIIDLSRLGSTETKSLIMGLFIIRLKEYRQSTTNTISSGLKHITVLEEAHNLLKRTSTEQSLNTANMTGKAVEMISNSLAELRSSGEGFIIVDQAPGLLDLSAIRNTNTKIILRLPEASDRELTGHAMSLSSDQIEELAKLPTGIAAVYQNDWLGSVLTQIPYYPIHESIYCRPDTNMVDDRDIIDSLGYACVQPGINDLEGWFGKYITDRNDCYVQFPIIGDELQNLFKLSLGGETKYYLCKYQVNNMKVRSKVRSSIVYSLFNFRDVMGKVINKKSVPALRVSIINNLVPSIKEWDAISIDRLIEILLVEHSKFDDRIQEIANKFDDYFTKKYLMGDDSSHV